MIAPHCPVLGKILVGCAAEVPKPLSLSGPLVLFQIFKDDDVVCLR